ncbi:MAG TPA: nuclear transport factor 2 family protein [Solirubrobacteraceae bacterium]
MSAQATTSFDLSRFCRALEERDSQTQVAMYAPAATVTIADRMTPPGSPRVIKGQDEIRSWIEDVSAREMTHAVQRSVSDEQGAALTEACRYPDGTNVLCATVFALSDGLITDQTVVQTWDES